MPIKKVLVVDDSPTERYFLTELLTRNGFHVSAEENADRRVLLSGLTVENDLLGDDGLFFHIGGCGWPCGVG